MAPNPPSVSTGGSGKEKKSDRTPITTTTSADSTTSRQPPSLNVISFCFLLVGIGALFGYTIFYVMFKNKCADLLMMKAKHHNESQAQLQMKYTRALDDIRQCQDDAQVKGELQELQGRLQAQVTLSDKHQDLLERHEKTLERISILQQSNEGSQAQIQTLKEGLKIVQVKLEESTLQRKEAQQEHETRQNQLQQHKSAKQMSIVVQEQNLWILPRI